MWVADIGSIALAASEPCEAAAPRIDALIRSDLGLDRTSRTAYLSERGHR
jgi:hypothetical protein